MSRFDVEAALVEGTGYETCLAGQAAAARERLAAYLAFDAEVDREQERVRDELRSYGLFVQ